MTTKRFVDYFDKDHNYIIQDLQNEDEYQVGFANCDEDVFLELINQLSAENEQLKSSDTITDLETQIMKLKKENEQLRKENYELHKRLGDFEPFEEYMKERTSKTSLEDIIGIVKTDEPTNSVELKKELYK